MPIYDRYEKLQKYVNGVPADPEEFMAGNVVETGKEYDSKEDCENNG